MFEAMGRAIAASGIKPVLDKVFPFDEAQAAYRHMASGVHFGNRYSRSLSRFSFRTQGGARHPVAPREEGVGQSRPAGRLAQPVREIFVIF
jgi:Zinc-binding dehydrogenase